MWTFPWSVPQLLIDTNNTHTESKSTANDDGESERRRRETTVPDASSWAGGRARGLRPRAGSVDYLWLRSGPAATSQSSSVPLWSSWQSHVFINALPLSLSLSLSLSFCLSAYYAAPPCLPYSLLEQKTLVCVSDCGLLRVFCSNLLLQSGASSRSARKLDVELNF